jgi:catechol 2,3-dioxygenase-like lactoylglutathione lyase family enzyme
MTDWFARPVLHVSSVEASIRFYVDRLGFTVAWRYEEDGRAFVAQVDRGSCALIFSDQWPEKVGKGLMFISLNVEPETHEAAVAALDALRAEFEARGVPVKDGHWGLQAARGRGSRRQPAFLQLSERTGVTSGARHCPGSAH